MSTFLRNIFGHWWVAVLLLVATICIFAFLVIPGAKEVVSHGPGETKLLDEYIMTWKPDDARRFLGAIGPEGREAYRAFYLRSDFWFPELAQTLFFISLFSLAFPAGSRFAWLNVTPIALWLVDAAENINHFTMAGSYPNLSEFSLTAGPVFTWLKCAFTFAPPIIALLGFIALGFNRLRAPRTP